MTLRTNPAFKSYAKTTVACLIVVLVALLLAFFALNLLPKVIALGVAAVAVLVVLATATLAGAGGVVLLRYVRVAQGEPDLFLVLNRSRQPAAIKAAAPARTARIRRWVVRRLAGHDLVVGDLVELKTWAEIRATLDERGCLENVPFMPEMLAMCGQRAYVFRCVHRLFDYRKTRRMRHMDGAVLLLETVCNGSSHGGCEAACQTIWKSAWLRRVQPSDDAVRGVVSSVRSEPVMDAAVLQFGTHPPRYACQLTQLHAASEPVGTWSVAGFLLPLVSGNVAPAAFVVGWLTYLFNELQHQRQGVSFPEFEAATQDSARPEEAPLLAGDQVVVRSSAEIRATLNDRLMHRGLWFEPDMLKHCGHRYRVQAEIRRLVDIVTGELLTMKTPAYILREVNFSGERQFFNAQHEPLFWRGAWLQRVGSAGSPTDTARSGSN